MTNETINISKCCRSEVIEKDSILDEESTYLECSKCHGACEVEEVCMHCYGTGEITTMERVYPNEPHMADIGTRKCHCQVNEQGHDE